MVWVPVLALELALNVTVDFPAPGAAIDVGLKLTVTPDDWPVAERAIAELKPPETVVVTVEVLLPPLVTVTEVGEAEMVKLGGAGAVTVKVTVVVLTVDPDVPVMVMG
jgi:hypothetical protein